MNVDMIKHIYVVRHCKAEGQEHNAKLTELGIQQAEQLAESLFHKDIDLIVSSPFERAYYSILPLAERLGIEIVVDNRLKERELTSENHVNWLQMLRTTYDDLHLCYKGGESSIDAMKRAIAVVKEVLDSERKSIVLVSHGNLISLLLKHFDDRIGFSEWQGLSNPDVFQLIFLNEKMTNLKRIWVD